MTPDEIAHDTAHELATAERITLIRNARQSPASRALDTLNAVRGVPPLLAIALFALVLLIWRLSL